MSYLHRPRPRRACGRCGKLVATHRDGRLWWHKRPGYGLWEDAGRCVGDGTRA